MQQQVNLRLLPADAADQSRINEAVVKQTGISSEHLTGVVILRSSIDARGRPPYIQLTVNAFIDEPFAKHLPPTFHFRDVSNAATQTLIVGAGPCGLFAALKLIELGIRPIIIERGKDVRARRRDLATLNKSGIINPESNYCFGEGGAGTYSDGKLYTRSSKRGDVNRILQLLVQFGAHERILIEAHPHIGTNKLPQIITAIREKIIECGGMIHFEKKLTGFRLIEQKIVAVQTHDGDELSADNFILATGHSARDIYELMHHANMLIEAKPFALGVRVEHPQELIDAIQYHSSVRDNFLPPASYSLVQQVEDKGVFSFCMCPGGIIAPASTDSGEVVVNGWSPSKRDNPFANSGIVVAIDLADYMDQKGDALSGLRFQQQVEQAAFIAGGGKFVAPAQRLTDFVNRKVSATLPACSYLPGVASADMAQVLPPFVRRRLIEGFKMFGRKMHGYLTESALVVATESRTSSPVRIPRDPLTLQHPQFKNLFPAGEGAGYAGGIVSAAMDGENVASSIAAHSQAR